MKKTIFAILFAISLPAFSEVPAGEDMNLLRDFKKECNYYFDDGIIKSIVSQDVGILSFEKKQYKVFKFRMKIKLEKKLTEAKLETTCPSASTDSPAKTPRQIIKEEDAGGRYFRHIAWEREISGKNWAGLVAYSDYLFGDSEKSTTYDYLICSKNSQCFSYSINKKPRLTAKERDAALDIFKSINYLK